MIFHSYVKLPKGKHVFPVSFGLFVETQEPTLLLVELRHGRHDGVHLTGRWLAVRRKPLSGVK